MTKLKILSGAVASVLVLAVGHANAVTTTYAWTGAGTDSLFNNAANWSPTVNPGTSTLGPGTTYPVNGDTAYFNSNGNGKTPTFAANPSAIAIFFDTASAAAYTLGTSSVNMTTNNGYSISVTPSVTTSQVINFNLQAPDRGAATVGNYIDNTSQTAGQTLTVNGNYVNIAATASVFYVLHFQGLGTKVYAGNISDSSALAGDTTAVTTDFSNTVPGGVFSAGSNNNGVTILSGVNTYTGATTHNVGTLLINGTNGTSAITVNRATATAAATAFGGSGSVAGPIAITGFSSFTPGGSTGNSTANFVSTSTSTSALTLASTSSTVFDINGTTRGTSYDAFTTAGTITYGGAFTINLNALPTGGAVYSLFSGLVTPGVDFASVTIAGSAGISGALTNTAGVWTGTFNSTPVVFTEATGNLVVGTVPEPASLGLMLGGASALLVRRRRNAN